MNWREAHMRLLSTLPSRIIPARVIPAEVHPRSGWPVVVEGKPYRNVTHAKKETGLTEGCIRNWIHRKMHNSYFVKS